ncbi:MAG: carboxypeptidase regulatory-like domain-containing protein [candidate division Zixibacteria bacterium]|nr:carboxypeptidase regulatory-like domain-containing protein [candidate division Zixibacteria bacterium]
MKKLLILSMLTALILVGSLAFAQDPDLGTISGTVTNEVTAEPLGQAIMVAMTIGNHPRPADFDSTDEFGVYELDVSYGDYRVMAFKLGYEPEFWEEADNPEDAAVVAVDEENSPTGIDFTLTERVIEPGSVAGVVTDFDTGDPIEDAIVALCTFNQPGFQRIAYTLADGSYLIDDLPPGTYRLACHKDGYVLEEYPDSVMVDDGAVTGIDFALEPLVFGSIAGTVTDAGTGDPVEGARIMARIPGHHGYQCVAFSGVDGTYLIDELIPGEYSVVCGKRGYISLEYPNPVIIDGNDVTGIDFALEAITMSGISGVVTDGATTEPIEGALVFAIKMQYPHCFRWALTNENGEYLIELPSGEYYMEARARGYFPGVLEDPVVVVDEIAANINFELMPVAFGSISGTVYDTAGVPISNAFVHAHKYHSFHHGTARTDSLGNYTIEHLIPGAYKVKAYAQGYIRQVYDELVIVGADEDVTGIDFYLEIYVSPFDGYIAGNVFDDATLEPIANACLVAISHRTNPYHHMLRFTRTDENGDYIFENLPDVEFKILCGAREYVAEFYDDKDNIQDADAVTPDADDINIGLAAVEASFRTLSGRIVENGQSINDAIVLAKQDGKVVAFGEIFDDGVYYINNLAPGEYAIEVISSTMGEGSLDEISVVFSDKYDADIVLSPTSVDDNSASLPTSTMLLQNYPNPFNSSTNISFCLAEEGYVNLTVYDMLGRKVTTLNSSKMEAGQHILTWNGVDSENNNVVSGLYLYVLKTGDETYTKRMLLLK